MSNENQTNSEKIKVSRVWLDADGEKTTLGGDAKPVAFIATLVNGEEIHRATLGDFTSQLPILAALGLRSILQYAAGGADDADEVLKNIEEKLVDVLDNKFSDRGGERGVNLEAVARVVAEMTGKDYSAILSTLHAQDETMEPEAFKKVIAQLRSNPAYKAAYAKLNPDRKPRSRKPSVDPLAALGLNV